MTVGLWFVKEPFTLRLAESMALIHAFQSKRFTQLRLSSPIHGGRHYPGRRRGGVLPPTSFRLASPCTGTFCTSGLSAVMILSNW